MKGDCICKICTCGRHRCPHNRGTIGKQPIKATCLLSEYQNAYERTGQPEPRASLKPPTRKHTLDVPMDVQTTYSQTYVKHEHLKPTEMIRAKSEQKPSTNSLELATTYKEDYKGNSGKRPVSYKPEYKYQASTAGFHKKTMYNVSYQQHGLEKWAWCRATPIKHEESIKMNNSKFEGTSTMKQDFKPHINPERAELVRRSPETAIEKGDFETTSTYKQEYTAKKTEKVKSIKPNPNPAVTSPFLGESTMRAAYKPIENHRACHSFKPHQEYHPCPVKFDGDTTASTAYKEWPVEKPEKPAWAKRQQYAKPKCAFSYTSSYSNDFKKPSSYERMQSAQPQRESLKLSHGDSNDNPAMKTQYQAQFTPYNNCEPSKSFKVVQTYESPKEAMVAESVYQASYQGKSTERAKLIVPERNSNAHKPLSETYTTTYTKTYKGENINNCPAKDFIMASPDIAPTSKNSNLEATGKLNGHFYFTSKCKSANVRNTQAKPDTVRGSASSSIVATPVHSMSKDLATRTADKCSMGDTQQISRKSVVLA